MVALLCVIAHNLDGVGVPLLDRLVIHIVLHQLLLDSNHQAADRVAVHRVLKELLAEVNHHHHIAQVVMSWELRAAGHPRILVEDRGMVLVHVEALANVASLLVM